MQAILTPERCLVDEPMSKHTSFRIGGPADLFAEVSNETELKAVLALMNDSETEHMLIGNGSNILVSDKGYRGVMIKLGGVFEEIRCEGTSLVIGAAALLSKVSAVATENGLAGFEFASGIPGSIGGAMFMNAGAYGGEMKDIVRCVRLVSADGAESFEYSNERMEFGYRSSAIQASGAIVTEVTIDLTEDNVEDIRARGQELAFKRNSKQPVQFPSAGSTFKRPPKDENGKDVYAARLIEEAGLKGTSVGFAEVSEKHAGFIINKGNATFSDVTKLMELVQQKVYKNSGIMLTPEVEILKN